MKLLLPRLFVFLAVVLLPIIGFAQNNSPGHLMIVGGGLRPDNSAVFERLIEYAGGKKVARFGVFPTASLVATDAKQLKLVLGRLGVPEAQIELIDIRLANAKEQAFDPQVVAKILACSGLYFEGGDQTRITRALTDDKGNPTPALAAIYKVWQKKGAVVAGSSAGAAMQSHTMISVGGLPDDSLDEGMDALDFGLTTNRMCRGLFVSKGLSFFGTGIIDQHFGQFRGRLGRLSRVVVETKSPYGFGIDENTALDVSPDGTIEVVGEGTVTIVEGAAAKLEDGPLGCRISGVRLSCLEGGDRFDPKLGKVLPRAEKQEIVAGKEANNGNFLIPDINGRGGAFDAIIAGLADNTARKQVGIALKHNQHFAHGYRFTFHKTDSTKCYEGYVSGLYSNTVIGVKLDIAPVDGTLRSPDKRWPEDLSPRMVAIFQRGILLADEDWKLRLQDKITRAELAGAIAQTVRLEPPRSAAPIISDLTEDAPFAEDISLVVGEKFMDLESTGAFQPAASVPLKQAAAIFAKVTERYHGKPLTTELVPLGEPDGKLTREQAAEAMFKIIGFSWATADRQ